MVRRTPFLICVFMLISSVGKRREVRGQAQRSAVMLAVSARVKHIFEQVCFVVSRIQRQQAGQQFTGAFTFSQPQPA